MVPWTPFDGEDHQDPASKVATSPLSTPEFSVTFWRGEHGHRPKSEVHRATRLWGPRSAQLQAGWTHSCLAREDLKIQSPAFPTARTEDAKNHRETRLGTTDEKIKNRGIDADGESMVGCNLTAFESLRRIQESCITWRRTSILTQGYPVHARPRRRGSRTWPSEYSSVGWRVGIATRKTTVSAMIAP